MGWKNVKEHYNIKHIVQVVKDKGICIGTGYVHDLIIIHQYAHKLEWGSLGPSKNDDLARYWAEMNADLDKLWSLIEADDTFEKSVTVYTYRRDGDIIEKKCEEPGWPNITHDGEVMYENTFSTNRTVVLKWAIREEMAAAMFARERIHQLEKDTADARKRHQDHEANLAKLRFEALYGSVEEDSVSLEKEAQK